MSQDQPTQTKSRRISKPPNKNFPPPRKRTGLWVWYQTRTRKVKIGLGCGIIIVLFPFLSYIGASIESTNLGGAVKAKSAEVVEFIRYSLSHNAIPAPTQQPTSTPTQAWTLTSASFPGLADTTSNIHLALPFDYRTNPTAMAGKVDMVWGTQWAGSLPESVYGLFYLPYDRDQDTRYYSVAHDITWYKANHPDWIEYKCDKSTVAYEYGDATSVPLDITNPAVVSYIEQTYLTPYLRPGSGYQGIGFDNLDFENAGSWTGQRCGHFDIHGTWVQQFTGTENDIAYLRSVLTWAQIMHTFMHTHFPNALMAVNFSYDPNFPTASNTLSKYVDLYIDEQGFTNGNNASPTKPSAWFFTDATWLGKMSWIQNALQLGRGFFSLNQEPVPMAQVTNNQTQWALANYLLVKNNASFVYICGFQQYGYLFIRPEYSAQIGSPVNAMYKNQNVYMRNFTNGIVIVNPSSVNTYTIQLSGTGYKDLYGNYPGSQVTLSAHSGLILIHP